MSRKVLIISSSPRKHGNSDTLCEEFARGAREAKHQVEKVLLAEKTVGYCKGCGACMNNGTCPQRDDMPQILESILAADVIVMRRRSTSTRCARR